jgi:hypothetical protein
MTAPAEHHDAPDAAAADSTGVAFGEREQLVDVDAEPAAPGTADPPPDRAEADRADGERVAAGPVDLGTPAGQLATGAALSVLLGGWLLYRAGGWTWVVLGAGALVALVVLAVVGRRAWRRRGDRPGRAPAGRSRPFRPPSGSSRPGLGGRPRAAAVGGGRRGGGVTAALGRLLTGRRTARPRSAASSGADASGRGGSGRTGPLRRARKALAALIRRRSDKPGATRRGSSAADRKGRRPGLIRRTIQRLTRRASAPRGRRASDPGVGGGEGGRPGWIRRGWRWLRGCAARTRHGAKRVRALASRVWRRARRPPEPASPEPEQAAHASQGADAAVDAGAQEATAEAAPTPETTTRAATAREGASLMTAFSLLNAALELPTAASAYESSDMMDVKGHLDQLPEVPIAVGTSIRLLTDRLAADYPIHQDVVEALRRAYESLGPAVEACNEAAGVFAASHEADIQRRLAPRAGEGKWNHH